MLRGDLLLVATISRFVSAHTQHFYNVVRFSKAIYTARLSCASPTFLTNRITNSVAVIKLICALPI
jgi:hypothetical protein